MNQFRLTNTRSGRGLGVYSGETPLEAYQAMMREAGYPDAAAARSAGFSFEVVPADLEAVAVGESLEGGG